MKEKRAKRELAVILLLLFLLLLFLTQKSNLKGAMSGAASISVMKTEQGTQVEIEPDRAGVDRYALLYKNGKLNEIMDLGYEGYIGFEKRAFIFDMPGSYSLAVYFYSENDWIKKEFIVT